MMMRAEESLRLPVRPPEPSPAGFPVIATVAPLLASGVIWAVTGSPFALIFAVLSPVIAVASMFDARRNAAKRRRTDAASHSQALTILRAAILAHHDALRQSRWQRTPPATGILALPGDASRWAGGTVVSLGTGTVASGLRLDGATQPGEEQELRDWAATLTDAPITADAKGGVGIVGPLVLGRAMARAVLVQLCFALHPDTALLQPAPPRLPAGWAWADALPHLGARSMTLTIVVAEAAAGHTAPAGPTAPSASVQARIIIATTVNDLPPGCATVVHVHGPGRAQIVRSPGHARGLDFRPELIAAAQAATFAEQLRLQARAAGLVTAHHLPDTVALRDLHAHPPHGLACTVGLGEHGDVALDLEQAGPHAVVGGTTGSGKSELLVTWVTALAATYPPAEVSFLLVDFKGGAAFQPLRALPHCVGLITDLDPGGAERALESLSAELRHRERTLQAMGVRDILEAGRAALPRLVIVVDEFATLLDAFPALHALFVDIAARGRSLGVHLVLCTQRPAGVVRDALLANCSLRVSLRVNNRADSQAVIGTDAAAALSAAVPGRAWVATGVDPPTLCQVASTGPGDIRAVADAVPAGPRPRRPWLDPLPRFVTEEHLLALHGTIANASTHHFRLGLLDEPERQRYRVAEYDPRTDGHLLVLGGPRSGKSTLLASLLAQAPHGVPGELVAPHVELAWDALEAAYRSLESGPAAAPRMLLLDDFDSVCARWEADYRAAAFDLVNGLLREGQSVGVHLVIAVQRLSGGLAALPALCQRTLLLRLPTVHEHVAAGGVAAQFDPTLPPGGGRWQGTRIQLLGPPGDSGDNARALSDPARDPAPALLLDAPLLVVSGSPARTAARLRETGRCTVVDLTGAASTAAERLELTDAAGGTVLVGDADTWQAQWAILGALRARAGIAFDGCGLADYRLISRRRDLPPPLAPGRGHLWLLLPDGTVQRASLPTRG